MSVSEGQVQSDDSLSGIYRHAPRLATSPWCPHFTFSFWEGVGSSQPPLVIHTPDSAWQNWMLLTTWLVFVWGLTILFSYQFKCIIQIHSRFVPWQQYFILINTKKMTWDSILKVPAMISYFKFHFLSHLLIFLHIPFLWTNLYTRQSCRKDIVSSVNSREPNVCSSN